MDEFKLRLGVPKGRLNSPGIFNTKLLLDAAGIRLEGYEPGKEDETPFCSSDSDIVPVLIRHEDGPAQLLPISPNLPEMVHLAIFGEDWAREWELSELLGFGKIDIPKVLDFGYARVKVVAAVSKKTSKSLEILAEKSLAGLFEYGYLTETPVLCATKYLNISAHAIANAFIRTRAKRGVPTKGGVKGVIKQYMTLQGRFFKPASVMPFAYLIELQGETERLVSQGLANVVVDNVATGATLRSHGLVPIETLVENGGARLYGHLWQPWTNDANWVYAMLAYSEEKKSHDPDLVAAQYKKFRAARNEKVNYVIALFRGVVSELGKVSYCVVQNPAEGLESHLSRFIGEGRSRVSGSGKPVTSMARVSGSELHIMVLGDSARLELERLVRSGSPESSLTGYPLAKVIEKSSLWEGWDGSSKYPFFSRLLFEENALTPS